jgi:hypothetical protein
VNAKLPGTAVRTREAIERTTVVLLGRLLEQGGASPGPPGAQHVDNARFRIERTLTPGGSAAPSISGEVRVSYTRRVFPQSKAEAPLEPNASYVLFCTVHSPKRVHALKIIPHSEETVRIVASAFSAGARHAAPITSDRIA